MTGEAGVDHGDGTGLVAAGVALAGNVLQDTLQRTAFRVTRKSE
ncbi:hypothetical protein ACFFOU_18620 [Pseudonocardia sulfidoxydans]|nr:hypothetical protein [Pseudonocardia sulfidoxydans]